MPRVEESLIVVDNPGKLRHVVTIEQPPADRTDSGAVVGDWTTFATIRAQVTPVGGAERLGADAFQSQSHFQVLARWLPGVDATMRLNFNGRLMDISDIDNRKERGRWMVISAVEGRSHGN